MTGATAAEALRESQHSYPPWGGADRAALLLQGMRTRLPPSLQLKIQNLSIAVGEVGLEEPAAQMMAVGSGQFIVKINSAAFELVDLVAHALYGFTTEYAPGSIVPPALTHQQLVERIAHIFIDQRAGKFGRAADYQRAAAEMAPKPGIAAALASHAMAFMLAHEFGHVLEAMGGPALWPAPRQWSTSEMYADWIGVRITLATRPNRMVYAGIVLAIRVYLYLERLGQTFAGPHPPLDVRFGLIKQMARSLFAHDIDFTAISTIALSYDELLEGVENYLARGTHATPQSVERVRVRLWAMLEARMKGEIEQDRLVADIQDALRDVDAATCDEVAQTFSEWFSESRPSAIPDPTNGRLPAMGRLLRTAIPMMPLPAKEQFALRFA